VSEALRNLPGAPPPDPFPPPPEAGLGFGENVPISTLPIAISLIGGEWVPLIQNDPAGAPITRRATVTQIAQTLPANPNAVPAAQAQYQTIISGPAPTFAWIPTSFNALPLVSSWNGKQGNVIMSAVDVINALGFTPYDSANPQNFQTQAQLTAALANYLLLAGGTITGSLNVTQVLTVLGSNSLVLSALAGAQRAILGQTGTSTRWQLMLGDGSAESGANAGSNFTLAAYSDTAAFLGNWLTINRATGAVTIPGSVTMSAGLAVNGLLALQGPSSLYIPGGTPGQVLSTNGSGGLSWIGNPGGIPEAPTDGQLYGRSNATWVVVPTGGGGGIADAPNDGSMYARISASWQHITHNNITDWAATLAPYALTANVPVASTTLPLVDSVAAIGNSATYARADHVHPAIAIPPPVTISATAPATPAVGQLWWDSVGGQLYVWYNDGNSSQWVVAVNSNQLGSISVGALPPTTPAAGALWWDSVGGQLYVWYNDGTSSQWASATNQMGGGFLPLTGGALTGDLSIASADGNNLTLSASGTTWPGIKFNIASGAGAWIGSYVGGNERWEIDLGNGVAETGANAGSNFQIARYSDTGAFLGDSLVINRASGAVFIQGSNTNDNPAAGLVGEVISSVNTAGVVLATGASSNITSIALTPGDWDVFGELWFGGTIAGATVLNGALTPTSGGFPTAPAMNTSRFQTQWSAAGGGGAMQFPLCPCRASIAAATSYYLVAGATYASGSCTVTGKIWARRAR
jgi:hypothetical protein